MIYKAELLLAKPSFIPRNRLRGSALAGITYERKIGHILGLVFRNVASGRWWSYYEDGVQRWACMDHVVVFSERAAIFECKLSENEKAWPQLQRYQRILQACLPSLKSISLVQVTKILRERAAPVVVRPEDALSFARCLWHQLA